MGGSAHRRYRWASGGDVGAFLGLACDNVAQLIVFSTLLIAVFRYPAELVLRRMLPGTALGVLVGDLIYTWLAFRLARRTGRDVTAMPLGIDTPSLFGLTFGVLGPLRLATDNPELAWQAGMALMVIMGVFKIALSFFAGRLLRLVPMAALLGTIGAVGLLLIAFFPLLKVFALPAVGLPALLVGLLCLLSPPRLPGALRHVPPVLLVVLACTAIYYALRGAGLVHGDAAPLPPLALAVPWPTLGFTKGLGAALPFLPVALPLALVTVIGGIDVTASAVAAGDEYETRDVLLTEGLSTLLAGLCGGVIQTTPYIGHPAYKRMGGRAAYTLGTALFVGLGGVLGLMGVLVHAVPETVLTPLLVFIGVEIASQSFRLVPERHGPAVAASYLPVIGNLAMLLVGQMLAGAGTGPQAVQGEAAGALRSLQLLSSGFVFSSLLWGAAVAFFLDGRAGAAAAVLLGCAAAASFGLIHSPLPGGALFLPGRAPDHTPLFVAAGYAGAALALFALRPVVRRPHDDVHDDHGANEPRPAEPGPG